MQENRFEKQVREQLDELQFHPTAPVWENVAASIRRRKRRRIAAYFSIIALLGIGIWAMTDGRRGAETSELRTPDSGLQTQNPGLRTPNAEDRAPMTNDRVEGSVNDKTPTDDDTRLTKPGTERQVTMAGERKKNSVTGNTRKANDSRLTRQGSERRTPVSTLRTPGAGQAVPVIAEGKESVNDKTLTPDASRLTPDASRLTSHASHPDSSNQASHEATLIAEAPHPSPAMPQQVSKRKISWAVEISGGAGRRQDEVLPGLGPVAEKVDLYQGSGVWAPPASFAVVRIFPSPSNAGPAFSIGASARIPLAKRINLVAGLRYQYQAEKIQVGIRKDTNIQFINAVSTQVDARAVYNGPASFGHTNRYHFIQAPIGIEFQLNRGRKTPIFLEAGAAPGYLVASSALVYDTAFNGIYYKDKSMLNKFHLTGSTALSIQFGNKGPFKWAIGPELRMNVTPLGESKYDNRQYLIYGGLRARFFLNR